LLSFQCHKDCDYFWERLLDFNTTKVRLFPAFWPSVYKYASIFQYHKGAIISRLEPDLTEPDSLFQYHKGAIISWAGRDVVLWKTFISIPQRCDYFEALQRYMLAAGRNFNTTKVRLFPEN